MVKVGILEVSLILSLMLVAVGATAEIYRWVDENGQVKFGDRPPPEAANSDEVVIRNQGPAAAETPPVDRKQARDRLLEQFQREREEKKEAAAKKRKEEKQNKIRCNYARDRLSSYQGRRIYVPQDNQERRYLSDQEREAVISKARADVEKWCK